MPRQSCRLGEGLLSFQVIFSQADTTIFVLRLCHVKHKRRMCGRLTAALRWNSAIESPAAKARVGIDACNFGI